MKKFAALMLVASSVFAFALAADARGGCGLGWHRGPLGGCRRNGEPVLIAPHPHRMCPIGWHRGPYGHRCFRNR